MKYQNFSIETEEMGLIGTVNLVDIDWKNRNAFNGIMLGDKDSRGKGYALDAVMARIYAMHLKSWALTV